MGVTGFWDLIMPKSICFAKNPHTKNNIIHTDKRCCKISIVSPHPPDSYSSPALIRAAATRPPPAPLTLHFGRAFLKQQINPKVCFRIWKPFWKQFRLEINRSGSVGKIAGAQTRLLNQEITGRYLLETPRTIPTFFHQWDNAPAPPSPFWVHLFTFLGQTRHAVVANSQDTVWVLKN